MSCARSVGRTRAATTSATCRAARSAPESYLHKLAKVRLQQWVRQVHPGLQVRQEVHRPKTGQFVDVMVTVPARGIRLALAPQYTAFTIETYLRRTGLYEQEAIVPVWLFGPTGHLGLPHGPLDGRLLRHRALHRRARAEGHPVCWMDLEALTVTTAVDDQHARLLLHGPLEGRGGPDAFVGFTDALADCRLGPSGLLSPTLHYLKQARARRHEAEQAARRVWEEEAGRRELARRARVEQIHYHRGRRQAVQQASLQAAGRWRSALRGAELEPLTRAELARLGEVLSTLRDPARAPRTPAEVRALEQLGALRELADVARARGRGDRLRRRLRPGRPRTIAFAEWETAALQTTGRARRDGSALANPDAPQGAGEPSGRPGRRAHFLARARARV